MSITTTTTTYRNLSASQRKALPSTLGATPHQRSVYIAASASDHKSTLAFLGEGFHIGLENYIDSASWRICDILKASNNSNKEASVFQLCLAAVAGWDQPRALKAWKALTDPEKEQAQTLCVDYLESVLDYLLTDFD